MEHAALPVTVGISRRPRPGREAELTAWAEGISREAAAFPGHLGARIDPPQLPHHPELTVLFSFATAAQLSAWETSPERSTWLRRAEELIDGPHLAHGWSGLEDLFAGSARPAGAPPRWRTAVVVGLALYPLSLLVGLFLTPHLTGLVAPLRTLVTTVVVIPLMTWVAVPVVSRLLARWLRAG